MEALILELFRIDNLFWGSGRFNVCFNIQSCRLNAMQGAIDLTDSQFRAQARWFYSMVFPQDQDGVLQTELKGVDRPLTLFDEQMNYEQLKAVRAILGQDYGQVSYLVSGPPGLLHLLHTVDILPTICDRDRKNQDGRRDSTAVHISQPKGMRSSWA